MANTDALDALLADDKENATDTPPKKEEKQKQQQQEEEKSAEAPQAELETPSSEKEKKNLSLTAGEILSMDDEIIQRYLSDDDAISFMSLKDEVFERVKKLPVKAAPIGDIPSSAVVALVKSFNDLKE